MREPTEDAIAADFARDRYVVKQQPAPGDLDRVARWCVLTFTVAAGCAAVVAAVLYCGWMW